MAMTDPRRSRWSGLHFLIRALGLTGVLVAGVALVLESVAHVQYADRTALGGAAVAGFALLVEVLLALTHASGRRSGVAVNFTVQIVLAVVLLAGLNLFSFFNYVRLDWTQGQLFTVPADVREQLSRLQGETTIVVYEPHVRFGQLDAKPDHFDSAAERKVVEKVRDLADEFQELFPPRFRFHFEKPFESSPTDLGVRVELLNPKFTVVVLDRQEMDYDDKLARLTATDPALKNAIEAAPENSVFFAAAGKVQRLAFHDIYQLDKVASQDANDGQGNLVLRFQGVEPFARRVLNLDEKQPRVAIGVVHEALSTEAPDSAGLSLGMAGAKKALSTRGIATRDLILKKWGDFGPPRPAVFTFDESKYERLDEQVVEADASLKELEEETPKLAALVSFWQTASLEELTKRYASQLPKGSGVTETLRRRQLAVLQPELELRRLMVTQNRDERKALTTEMSGLNVDSLAEQRRIEDVKAKTDRMLADCDLLILPRMTLLNVTREGGIQPWLHWLDPGQVAAIKEFLKAGKPVLACFGPINEQPSAGPPPPGVVNDGMEQILGDLGIKFGAQTVLFNIESKSFAERRSGLLIMGVQVEPPPVKFERVPGGGKPATLADTDKADENEIPPNPVQQSLNLTARSFGKDQPLDLKLRHPRPVYVEPRKGTKPTFAGEFMMADEKSWNESQPFPTPKRTPRFEEPKPDDPKRSTLDQERRGPFPIGVAVETQVPSEWYDSADEKKTTPATVRVAAIGHGGVFRGQTLAPVQEKLLLDVCNWLMGRDDLLTKDTTPWRYPRVALTEPQNRLWQWGVRLGLPIFFVYLGLIVLMMRRMR